ncbi:hypothetical protein ACFSUJ_21045 [Streptomyces lusitanus]|uniref:Uncharacterized protein n=1 Tax=Streptomyces lusitanus TaxID=68232 RepID=A0ABU3JSE9_9ACTN|nr:hypothetical protein [Streptomyces lusitanus]
MARGAGETVVPRDVFDIEEDVYAGDFKVELSQGFSGRSAGRVKEYVVTPQLQEQCGKALKLIRGAVRKNSSYAAYLHESFGAVRGPPPWPVPSGTCCSARILPCP